MLTASDFAQKLASVKRVGNNSFMGRCPAHDDKNASLWVAEGENGKVVFKCHAGCNKEDILARLNLTWGDLMGNNNKPQNAHKAAISHNQRVEAKYDGMTTFGGSTGKRSPFERNTEAVEMLWGQKVTNIYRYYDEKGVEVFQKLRFYPKAFKQRRNVGGKWVYNLDETPKPLYNLKELIEAVKADQPVVIVEGERDADNLMRLGITATCNFDGAAGLGDKEPKWKPHYNDYFRNACVYIIPDNDPQGAAHAQVVAQNLIPVARYVKIVELPSLAPKEDVSDWLLSHGELSFDEIRKSFANLCDRTLPLDAQHLNHRRFVVENVIDLSQKEIFTSAVLKNEQEGCLLTQEGTLALYAIAKAGKSFLSIQLAAALASNTPFLGFQPEKPFKTLYLDREVSDYTFQKRINGLLEIAEKSLPRKENLEYRENLKQNFLRVKLPSLNILNQTDFSDLAKLYESVMPDCVIYDPLGRCFDGDENSAETVKAVFNQIDKLKAAYGGFAVVIHHLGKQRDDVPLTIHSGRGNSAFGDCPESVIMMLKRYPLDEKTKKPNLQLPPYYTVGITGRDLFTSPNRILHRNAYGYFDHNVIPASDGAAAIAKNYFHGGGSEPLTTDEPF